MKKIKFLSVSAVNMFATRPNKFYMQRLAEESLPRDPQSLAAAAGTQFDINVKKYVLDNNLLGAYGSWLAVNTIKKRFCTMPWPQPEKEKMTLDELFNESIEEQNRTKEIKNIGKELLKHYLTTPIFKDTQFYDIENRRVFDLNLKLAGTPIKIPIYAILDCILEGKDMNYPMDLKVSGYSSGASPKPFYCAAYENGLPYKIEKWNNNIRMPFEEIDETWAMQGCVYGWSLGYVFKPFPFEIQALFIGKPKKNGSRSIKVCQYKGMITVDFQKHIALQFINCWDVVNGRNENVPWCKNELLCEMQSYTEKFGWSA